MGGRLLGEGGVIKYSTGGGGWRERNGEGGRGLTCMG